MNVTATLNGESVTIVDITTNGSTMYVSYIDSSNNLKVQRQQFGNGYGSSSELTIATGAAHV